MKEKCSNCKHCDSHVHNHESEEIEKKDIILYIISVLIFGISFLPILKNYQGWLCLVAVVLSGYELIIDGIKNIFKLNFEEDTLMTIAIVAAFILGEFPESCMIILLFKLGEFLEDKAVESSNKSIKNIVKKKINTANIVQDNNEIKQVNVLNVKTNDIIMVKPGEMIPVDCVIIKGTSNIDMSSITGESIPVEVHEKDKILSGCININGSIICKAIKDYKNSTASQIADLVDEAKHNKGKTEEFITKFSKIYTPTVIVLAIIVGIFMPIILRQEFKIWILRALVFLVASCPCSIVISVPLAFFSCIGVSAKNGLLIKGTKHIEELSNANYVVFDKTGTITTGKMQIDKLVLKEGYLEQEFLSYLYLLEKNSNHPISTAIMDYAKKNNVNLDYAVEDFKEIAGYGIKATINNKQVLFGNNKLLEKHNISQVDNKNANYLIIDGNLVGYVTFKEEIRQGLETLVKELKKVNVRDILILTGDNEENSLKIAKQIKVNNVYFRLLPKEKLEKVKQLKSKRKSNFYWRWNKR